MKICITSQKDSMDSDIDPRFGRCQYFIIYDMEKMQHYAKRNENLNETGGVGIKSAKLIDSEGVKVLLTGRCGPNALEALHSANIKVITGVNGCVRDAIEMYRNGKFEFTLH